MIKVEKDNKIFPFSKGILANSILVTNLSIDEIYSIVEEVQKNFQSRKEAVHATEVRAKVIDILDDRGLENEKKRYRISRKIAQIEKPFAILIGGTAGVGKSTVSAELTRRLGIERVIATDEIREVMRYMLPEDLLPTLHQSSFDAGDVLTGPDIHENVILGFTQQASLVNRGVYAYLKRSEKEGLKTIFNGVHLVPGMLKFQDEEDSIQRFHFLLTLEDKEKHLERFGSRARGSYRQADRYTGKIDRIRRIQEYSNGKIENTNVKRIENVDINTTVTEIIDHLVQNLQTEFTNE